MLPNPPHHPQICGNRVTRDKGEEPALIPRSTIELCVAAPPEEIIVKVQRASAAFRLRSSDPFARLKGSLKSQFQSEEPEEPEEPEHGGSLCQH